MKAMRHLRPLPSNLFFALVGATLLLLTPAPARAQYGNDQQVSLSSFRPNETAESSRYRLRDGDVIMLTEETRADIPPDYVEIVLRSAETVTWWKEIKLTTGTYLGPDEYEVDRRRTLKSVSTQDANHGPTRLMKPMRFNIRQMTDAYGGLVFSKAKFLGAHTEVYYLPAADLLDAHKGGKRLTFTWQVD